MVDHCSCIVSGCSDLTGIPRSWAYKRARTEWLQEGGRIKQGAQAKDKGWPLISSSIYFI